MTGTAPPTIDPKGAVHGPDGASPHHPVDDGWPDRFAGTMLVATVFVTVVALVPPWRDYFRSPDDLVSLLTILIGLVLMSGAIVLVVRAWPQFVVRRVAGSFLWALLTFLVGGAVVLLGGAALVSAFGDSPDFGSSASYVIGSMLTDVGRVGTDAGVHAPLWVRALVGITGTIVVVLAAGLLFRAPRESRTLPVADEAKARALLRDFGDHDSLGYFATRRDKAVVWDTADPQSARAGVSYAVFGSVCLASGNPLGEPQHWAAAIAAWLEHARHNGWSAAVMGAGAEGAKAYADAGLTAYDIGDEAIVDMAAFSLTGPGMKEVRRSFTRLQRRGYTARVVRHASLTEADFAALSDAAGAWRGDGGDERGFSMALGRLADPLDGGCVLVQALDSEGRLRGFLSFVPWGRSGLSLDLMRRDPAADNGLIEFMVASLAGQAATFGIGLVSLNFAMFREAFERGAEVGAGPVLRLWRQGLLMASKNWQLESLYRSNAKYLPEWQPRFICFEYTSDLPRVGIAAGSAEGFLTRPTISLLRRTGKAEDTLETGEAEHAAAVLELIPPPRDIVAEALSTAHLPEQMRVRRAKLDRLREQGVDPYPVGFPRTHTLEQVRTEAGELPPDASTGRSVSVAGRVMLKRDMGQLAFATLR